METLFAGFTLWPRWSSRSGNSTFSALALLASSAFGSLHLNFPFWSKFSS
jgi:hypothetical protein